ncbi:protocatechuate 3,4-dioxygenase subunit alpha [Roseomonas marmotae]|uniref:Protocatechuate 3,4-dioxygenase subunit alpha n=1 Tax=Roseomonas marmotae TaxID=2768161 RepID=A0ABS3KB35_9PROT|nr:protocatechuate 3,4-dioxygenase subunit alpha [Roseomonas marmotae]MBO1074655.1 protocatechuate 3,4-dioxygenase subunit alpha [Roseomonas marmotae]QTI81675.1 protocatechuate 3,4-dioxygenase subunit alpha [Roseomonas marmotae]
MTDAPTPEAGPAIASASQTAGPYWHLVDFPEWADTTRHFADALPPGERITLTGRVTDGAGAPVGDAMVEIWHADPRGEYPDPEGPPGEFQGYGRCATRTDGSFRFTTLKPGPVPVGGHERANRLQAPHVALAVFARGLLHHLSTRLYFEGEPLNDSDPVLNAVEPARRGTLVARRTGPGEWSLDLRLQGEGETVWMAV